jgi:lipopolysaccharide/colanic/teichoic acid biosynthesis glycosyltransferase
MAKRTVDILASLLGLLALSPLLAVVLFLIWRQDGHSPFYIAERAGRGGKPFRMVKIRSMIVRADATGVESTSASDNRITPIGHFVRKWKLDELSQLWNVLKGDMSLVGPRPNTLREVADYTPAEQRLLSVKPGITDISSIVFSDEGEILRDQADPDKAYGELIRPWKSRLGLVYVEQGGTLLDLHLIWLTLVAIVKKERALDGVQSILTRFNVDAALVETARRAAPLKAAPLP